MSHDRFVIAIDGPAASGKSTVAAAVAEELEALVFDTGAVYRALTLAALQRDIPPDDGERLAQLIDAIVIQIAAPSKSDGRQYDVLLDGDDVTWAVRETRVDEAVSAVSEHKDVRAGLLDLQRQIGHSGRVVMPGRDIGTVVMPDADLKIWLDASLNERARRRHAELVERGSEVKLQDVRADMQRRDQQDASRTEAPMTPADDAVIINTDGRDVADVVQQIVQLVSIIPAQDRLEGSR